MVADTSTLPHEELHAQDAEDEPKQQRHQQRVAQPRNGTEQRVDDNLDVAAAAAAAGES